MNPDLQTEILNVVAQVRALSPDVRMAQLFAHLGFLGEAHLNRGLGYLDDDELLALLYRHRAELLGRLHTTTPVPIGSGDELSVSGDPRGVDSLVGEALRQVPSTHPTT